MMCPGCHFLRPRADWSPLQWRNSYDTNSVVVQAPEGERNCCIKCSCERNWFRRSLSSHVPPTNSVSNSGSGAACNSGSGVGSEPEPEPQRVSGSDSAACNSGSGAASCSGASSGSGAARNSDGRGSFCSDAASNSGSGAASNSSAFAAVFLGIRDVTHSEMVFALNQLRNEIPPNCGFFPMMCDRLAWSAQEPLRKQQLIYYSQLWLGFKVERGLKFLSHFGAVRVTSQGLALAGLQKHVAYTDADGVQYVDFANDTYALVLDMVWPGPEIQILKRSREGKGDIIEAILGWAFLMRMAGRDGLAERICRHLEIVIFFVYRNYEFYSAYYAADRNVSSNHS